MSQNSIQEEIKTRLKLAIIFCLPVCYLNITICRTKIFCVVLYGCETWSLTLREEPRLRMLENRVLRRIFGLKRNEVTGEWRRIHNEEL